MKLGRTLMALLCMQVLNPKLAPDSHAAEPKIVMLLWRGITEPEEAYLDRLQTLGINAKLVQLDAQQDRNAVVTHLRSMEDDIASGKIDIVYSFGTTVTRTATQFIKDRVPIVSTWYSIPYPVSWSNPWISRAPTSRALSTVYRSRINSMHFPAWGN
ncbi:hypothetical protein JL101_024380 [Skermanella rosea]|uniref:hypothetical protein n=1 Tax=Skermanella rosea TaxID=1817965 RepID=UPI001932884B|nr:hypothetical protein [Skermanella rosea]UEM03074.1 hypothetical protein JL101_024380 [Skermanella rosea]